MSGRKPLVAKPASDEPVVLEAEFSEAMDRTRKTEQSLVLADNQYQARVRAVATQVGYQLPADCVDPDLVQRDIAANMRRSVEACLEVGRGLTVLKTVCQHGEFLARLDVLGVEPRVAQRFIQSAMKFSNASTSTHLVKALGSQSKLFEMLVLDDEQIEELELTGQTGELKLDDVATMSVKELRAKVRELKGDIAAKEEVLSRRATQVNELEEKLARVKSVPPDEALNELQTEATKWLNDTRGAITGKFAGSLEALASHYIEHGGESILAFMAGMVGQIQVDLNALRDRLNIPDVAPALIPEWVGNPEFESLAG